MNKLVAVLLVMVLVLLFFGPVQVKASGVLTGTPYQMVEIVRQFPHSVSGVIEEDPSCGYMVSPVQGYSMCLLYDQSQENMLHGLLGRSVAANGPVYVLGEVRGVTDPGLRDEYKGMEILDIRSGRGELLADGGQPIVAGGPWLFPDSDRRYLTDQDLAPLSKDDLWRARNEIYARRGYIFQSSRGQAYVATLGGHYQAATTDISRIETTFNPYEKKNVISIKQWEMGQTGSSGQNNPVNSPWLFPDSDRRYLTEGDLNGLTRDDLWRARNEIYARRGYLFSTDKGRAYARSLGGYYNGREADVGRVAKSFNKFERYNVKFIKDRE